MCEDITALSGARYAYVSTCLVLWAGTLVITTVQPLEDWIIYFRLLLNACLEGGILHALRYLLT